MQDSDQKQRIHRLMEKRGIGKETDLYRKILNMNGDESPYNNATKNKANFNKMVSGERSFKEEYIVPLEKILGTSYAYIKEGGREDFIPTGIRYTAYVDEESEYAALDSGNKSGGGNPLLACDEYENDLLDYIIQYNSLNGIRYLVKKDYLKLFYDGKRYENFIANRGLEKTEQVTDLVVRTDDVDIFDSYADVWTRFPSFTGEDRLGVLKQESVLSEIAGSDKIWKSMLVEKMIPLPSVNRGLETELPDGMFCSLLLKPMLEYLLLHEKDYSEKTKELLEFAIRYNRKCVSYFNENFGRVPGPVFLDDEGFIKDNCTKYGSLVVYELGDTPDVDNETSSLMEKLNTDINSFSFASRPLIGGFSGHSARIVDGMVVKKATDNSIEYDALDFFGKCGVSFVPKLLKTKDGLDYFTYFKGNTYSYVRRMDWPLIEQVVKSLKELNERSKQKLEGKVYVHGDLFQSNVVFDADNQLTGIIDWDHCHIGEEYEDLVYVMWTWINLGDQNKLGDDSFLLVKKCLEVYGADEALKEDWADKMVSVMEGKLCEMEYGDSDYERVFYWVRGSEAWVEFYRNRIKEEIG